MAKIIALLLFYLTSFPSHASETNSLKFLDTNWNDRILYQLIVGPTTLDIGTQFDIAPPPLNNSDVTKLELQYLHKMAKNNRDTETVDKIVKENRDVYIYDHFIREGLIDQGDTTTLNLLELMDQDVRYFVLRYKKIFARPRPSEIDSTLDLTIPNPGHPAYPSGHATQSYAMAMIMADFDPGNAETYMQFARDMAKRREIAGVHYPSDSEAGQDLAIQILEKLRQNPTFEKQYQMAKKIFQNSSH